MATMNTFPPDVPKNADDADIKGKASDMAAKASETVKEGYAKARDAISDMDPAATAREGGEMLMRAIEKNPVMAFGLGALSMGLIAWASLRETPRSASSWQSYQPDLGRVRRFFNDYAGSAAHEGRSLAREYGSQAREYGDMARHYAEDGSRMLMHRAEKEPLAAIVGIGLAVYCIGSLLSSGSRR